MFLFETRNRGWIIDLFCCWWLIFLQKHGWKRRLGGAGLQHFTKKEVNRG